MSSPYPPPATGNPGFPRPPGSRLTHMLGGMAWQVIAVTGAVSTALGVVVLVWPGVTLRVVGVLFGIYLLISGILQLAGAFADHVPGYLRAIGLVVGTLSILLGLISFRGAAESILLLALWIGFGWLMRGIGHTVMVSSAPAFPGRGWLIAGGVITAIAGVVVISAPVASIATLAVLAGIWLVVVGVSELVEAFRLRRGVRG